jgi:hypothetical protein
MAQRDNTGKTRWQLRQTFSVSTRPPGNATGIVADALVWRSSLAWDLCHWNNPLGGQFVQLIDFDHDARTARVGFAKLVADGPSARDSGLCFVDDDYEDPAFAIGNLYGPTPAWPDGLPAPMPQPWHVQPVSAVEYRSEGGTSTDFDVGKQRRELLRRLGPGGDLRPASGVFYIDEARGYMHGYSPLAYIVLYDTTLEKASSAASYDVIPIRETEITTQLNDPLHPNCVGSYLGDGASPPTCSGSSSNRAWGCPPGDCGRGEAAPNKIEGYFLLAEAEQIQNSTLQRTLCSIFGGGDPSTFYGGWMATKRCREDPRWDPTNPKTGLPHGDWCAETNGPATDDCHDAVKSVSYTTFQGFPIQDGTCRAL